MKTYITTVEATSNSTPNTEDVFVEIFGFGGCGQISRVSITCVTENSDCVTKVRLTRNSTAGTGGTSGSAIEKDVLQNTNATVNVKNGTTAFSSGTIVDVMSSRCVNGKAKYVWQPTDDDDEIVVDTTGSLPDYFAVLISSTDASVVYKVSVEFREIKSNIVHVEATTNSTANTEDQFVHIAGGSGATLVIKRVQVCAIAASNTQIKVRFVRMTTAGTGGVSFTLVRKRTSVVAAPATGTVKDTTVDFTLGTVAEVYDQFAFTTRDNFEWLPANDDEQIAQGSLERFSVVISASQVSVVLRVLVEFEG